jgi:sulfatase modifying factor 1
MYMSPEQVKSTKDVTSQSDIYSLGVVLWQMVMGKKPYDSATLSTFELQMKIVLEPLALSNSIWDSIIQKATEKELVNRFKQVSEFKNALNNPMDGKVHPKEESDAEKTIVENLYQFYQANEVPTVLSVKPIIEWVDIPAGTFMMGSPGGFVGAERGRSTNEDLHEVTLSAFKMSKYTITFDQYDQFCEATGREKPKDQGWGRGKMPVIHVNWFDAQACAEWMGCRLPTEAEWEYACRAGRATPFNSGQELTENQGNYNGLFSYSLINENQGKTKEVGSYAPNAMGLYDMHGNVWEWCSDWYGFYPKSAQLNPIGPNMGECRVCRGGSWHSFAQSCRSAFRLNYITPDKRKPNIGFRIVSLK